MRHRDRPGIRQRGVVGADADERHVPPGHEIPLLEQSGDALELALEAGERWWGGAAEDGLAMPFGMRPFARDLGSPEGHGSGDAAPSNQSSPVLLSNRARVIWSERPFAFAFEDGLLRLSGRDIHASGLDEVTDQFFLGPDLIVAPVTAKSATERSVAVPAGRWRRDDGVVVEGPARVTVACDLARIPRFERLAGA
ncbi:hypothetical protein [Nonomuraea sp. NPDC049709]|uniref:hypothetical protein n=1 Tax=Nonomuraea sp. NPDC049709 TaxID=3154736 RepID=UPI003447D064